MGGAATRRLSTWFWAAYLVATQTPGMSAVQSNRQLGLSLLRDSLSVLHKLRAGMVRPHQDRIVGRELSMSRWTRRGLAVGVTRRRPRRSPHVLVACDVEARHRKPGTAQGTAKGMGPMQGRVRLAVAADPKRQIACKLLMALAAPGRLIVTTIGAVMPVPAKPRLRSPRHRRMWGSAK